MVNLIITFLSSISAFFLAYTIKKEWKNGVINSKHATIKDNGEVVTFLGNYNSKYGYLKYRYVVWLILGFYSLINVFIYSIFKTITDTESLVLSVSLILAEFIAYIKCKSIIK